MAGGRCSSPRPKVTSRFITIIHAGTILLFGDNLVGYKWLPMAFGLLTIALSYALAKKMFGVTGGAADGGVVGGVLLADHVFTLRRAACGRAAVDAGRVLFAVPLTPALSQKGRGRKVGGAHCSGWHLASPPR